MSSIKTLILAILVVTLIGCPDRDFGDTINLTIKNRSSEDILALRTFQDINNNLLPESNPYMVNSQVLEDMIQGNSEKAYPEAYRELFEMDSFSVLVVTIFSKDTIDQVPWEEIIERNLILRRYELTEDELDSLDWRIEYP